MLGGRGEFFGVLFFWGFCDIRKVAVAQAGLPAFPLHFVELLIITHHPREDFEDLLHFAAQGHYGDLQVFDLVVVVLYDFLELLALLLEPQLHPCLYASQAFLVPVGEVGGLVLEGVFELRPVPLDFLGVPLL